MVCCTTWVEEASQRPNLFTCGFDRSHFTSSSSYDVHYLCQASDRLGGAAKRAWGRAGRFSVSCNFYPSQLPLYESIPILPYLACEALLMSLGLSLTSQATVRFSNKFFYIQGHISFLYIQGHISHYLFLAGLTSASEEKIWLR